jgi:DDE superfamily endonuclease
LASGRPGRTKLVLAHQLIRLLAARYPQRTVHVVADGAYAGHSPLGLPQRVSSTSRLRRDAAPYALPKARRPGQPGRPRRKGQRLDMLAAFHRAMLTEYQHTDPKLTDALLTWEVTAA